MRPLDGVEGDVLFEADRIRAGYALYTDPVAGAFDYGPVPARYLVLYPPLWSGLLSLAPSVSVARALGALSWFGVLGYIARGNRAAWVAAAAIAGTWVLSLYGASGRPDAPALAACGVALWRATTRKSFDWIVGVLFALAAWLKPNVIGIAPGVLIGVWLVTRNWRSIVPGVLSGAALSAVIVGILSWVSHGQWLSHLLASTAQPPNMGLWLSQLGSRGPFFALPFAFALWMGRRSPIPFAALITSLAWMIVSLAKIGSASNYFMEPCLAALAIVAVTPLPPARNWMFVAALAQGAYNGVANVRSAIEHIGTARAQSAALVRVRETCRGIVIADEPGFERMLNGRIVQTPFQSTHSSLAGLVEAWSSDVARPEITCLVMEDDLLERRGDSPVFDRFGPPLRTALRANFELAGQDGGYFIYRRRP